MGALDELRRLTETAGDLPPHDGRALFRSARRRQVRRRAGAGVVGALVVAVAVVVAVPGAGLRDRLVIDEVAGSGDGAGEVAPLELPEGWHEVAVGGARFGVPGDWRVAELGADDPVPCGDLGLTAFLVTGGWPAATHSPSGAEYACTLEAEAEPHLLAAPLGEVPDERRGGGDWDDTSVAGSPAEVRVTADTSDPLGEMDSDDRPADHANRLVRYRVPAVDLYLEITTNAADIDLVDAIVDTVTPATARSREVAEPNVFAVPAQGSADAAYLADGTPVFVARTDDGEVHVLDALDPHLASKLDVHCPATGLLLEPRAEARYRLDGSYVGGPTPRDLDRYPTQLSADGDHVTVTGPLEDASGRSPPGDASTTGWCTDVVRHEPDTARRDLPLVESARGDGRWRWAYLRADLDGDTIVLCHGLRGCDGEGDQVPYPAAAGVVAERHPDPTPRWALLRSDGGDVEVRFAPRRIEIAGTRPPSSTLDPAAAALDRLTSDLLRSTRHLREAGGVKVDRADPSTALFLRFDEDGWFSADSPCGDRYGRYELDGPDRIRFTSITSNGTGCDAPLDTAIADVLDAGEDRTVRTTDEGDLILTAPDGAALIYSYR